jgi:hypothetical protein
MLRFALKPLVTAISRQDLVVRTSRQQVNCSPAQGDHIGLLSNLPGRSPWARAAVTRYVWAVYGTLKFSTTENLRYILLASICSDREAVFMGTLTTQRSVYPSNRELLKPS